MYQQLEDRMKKTAMTMLGGKNEKMLMTTMFKGWKDYVQLDRQEKQ